MDSNGVNQIVRSLEVIYNPRSSNDERHKSQEFLETIKAIPESPYWGYQLSLPDNKYDFIVRHYGLNLLLNAITKDYENWDTEKQIAVRNWIIELSTKVSPTDPHYMKEKVAFLWVEIAKRCWGLCLSKQDTESVLKDKVYTDEEKLQSWASMDSNLLELWEHSAITRELSLIIFRALFEDVYLLDDPIVSQRNNVLSSLCPEVVTSEMILMMKYEPNESLRIFAASNDGWLFRWSNLLQQSIDYLLSHPNQENEPEFKTYTNYVIKILQVFKTSLYWVLPLAFRHAGVLEKLSNLLKVNDIKIQTLTFDCLQVIFTRSYSEDVDFNAVIGSIYQTDGLAMLFKAFKEIEIDSEDIDDSKYTLLKKLVEMIVGLSDYLHMSDNSSKFELPETADISNYYKLVLETTKHESLVISGLSLQFWCSMLRMDELSDKPEFEQILPDLLETCANRLINYSDYDENIAVKNYLEIDFESQSEATTFLSNFKKMNDDIVRIIICKKPKDGLNWLATRLNDFYSSPIGSESLNNSKLIYKGKGAETFIYGYAQFVVIESCVRGISRWLIWYQNKDFEEIKSYLIQQVDELCKMLMILEVKDPMLLRKQVQTLVQFTPLLKDASDTMFKVLEKVMESCTFEYPTDATDDERESIRDLRTSGGTELNRLAYLMPESLKHILPQLENAITSILSSKKLSDHEAVAFKSFLLVVSQRSSIENKSERFSNIVDPELIAWSDPATEKGLLELHWFMERLGIVKIAEYFQSRGITAETNLLEAEMDENGRNLKRELKDHWSSVFPIRATRIFIQYSIEKLDHESETYQDLLLLWKPRIKPILPHILQLIYQIQAYHNPANWEGLPSEVQSFVKYSCMERFWQQGVSIQSKESFMDESVKAMHTLRDFADSVGHIVRYTREYAYLTISSISELEETLYEIPGCATMLWKALTGESIGITLHSWRHMINLVIRNIIKNCPEKQLDPFMIELLPQVLIKIDELLTSKWSLVYQKGVQLEGNESDEQLSEEMMEEHMLRQLTAVVDRMLIDLIGQQISTSLNNRQLKTRELIFNNLNILAPLLKLLCNIINFKDTRCSFNAILIIKHIIQDLISLNNEQVDLFLSENLIQTLLTILKDKFYIDTHPEAAYTLTILYMGLRYKSPHPAIILQRNLNITSKELSQFEIILMNCKKLRERRNCFLKLIQTSCEKLENENGNGTTTNNNFEDMKLKERNKQIENAQQRRNKKGSNNGNILDDFEETNTLNNLFGNE
ncbi:hypothetical protein CANARDRAFT_8121 [[Candida] arabinofermentans NRRL YB-2248]|uniref:Exportin-5 C-terminal domain-containing protein n=1 Tax=[Candida] arabinofermentans NRRL YB-2248 TaxID=983967 RepID=A0A1E4SZS2_9ASCO|nr:hypothetical protein CANARDRAFT_8121 [[Candida] arabinofermentans NRRL YB-2248]